MAYSTRTVPIIIASVVAILLVAGAYVLSGPIPLIDRVTAESSEELLRAYAVKDTDSDGLTDWQEELYGTDPANPTSFRVDLLDGEAARQELLTPKSLVREQEDLTEDLPGTDPAADSLTEAFSKKFLAQYLSTRGAEPPSSEEIANFVSEAISDLIKTGLATPRYDTSDVKLASGNDAAAFATYLSAAQSAFDDNDMVLEDRDVAYIRAAIDKDDPEALKKLEAISATYDRIAKAFIVVPTPRHARDAHLAIANALAYLSTATADIAAYKDDPIRTLLGIGEYREAVRLTLEAFTLMYGPMTQSGVVVAPSAPEYDFYTTVLAAPESLKAFRAATATQ